MCCGSNRPIKTEKTILPMFIQIRTPTFSFMFPETPFVTLSLIVKTLNSLSVTSNEISLN